MTVLSSYTNICLLDIRDIKDAQESTPQVWALIDSNRELKDVEEVYYESGIFIVQTVETSDKIFRILLRLLIFVVF